MMVLVSLTFFIGFKDSQESVQAQVKWAAANALAFVWKHKVTLPQLGQKKQEKDLKELAPLAIAHSDKASTDKEAKGTPAAKDKEAKGTPAANSFKEMYHEDRFVFYFFWNFLWQVQ